jgi:hypothetical protein
MRQIVSEREKRRRIDKQSSHQIIFDEVKIIVKLVSNEKSTQILRNVDEEHFVQKNQIA